MPWPILKQSSIISAQRLFIAVESQIPEDCCQLAPTGSSIPGTQPSDPFETFSSVRSKLQEQRGRSRGDG